MMKNCKHCNGYGVLDWNTDGVGACWSVTCVFCQGTGESPALEVEQCAGTGKEPEDEGL